MKAAAAFCVWAGAGWIYLGYRRSGERGFKRLAAFMLGWPATLAVLLVIPEGTPRTSEKMSVEEEEALLQEEIRRARPPVGPGRSTRSAEGPLPSSGE